MPLSFLLGIFPVTQLIESLSVSLPKLFFWFRDSTFAAPKMGVFGILRFFNFWVCIFFFFTFCFRGLKAEDGRKPPPPNTLEGNIGNIAKTNPSTPPPLSVPIPKSNVAPFKPSIAVIVGVLTTMFSITFLLLLYAKHCKRGNDIDGYNGNPNSRAVPSSTARKNSGIDPSVIDSLPIFRFGSLRGQKDGLECAVCLNRFEPSEVLRLLPKCKHAFHVECVDTWLDAHSTCPLCRYRVDPEDVLLVEETKLGEENEAAAAAAAAAEETSEVLESRGSEADSRTRNCNQANPNPPSQTIGYRRISGRHSSAGEKASHFVLQRPADSDAHNPGPSSSSRRSLDSVSLKRENESVTVGCFDRGRKDGLLLTEAMAADRQSFERRFEHRIIVSAGSAGFPHRWSDLQPSDLLFLRSEMIITDSGRFSLSSGSRPSISSKQHNNYRRQEQQKRDEVRVEVVDDIDGNGRSVINSRSVSEITGLNRFSNRASNSHHQNHGQGREDRAIRRWMAWISHSERSVRLKPRASIV